MKRRDFFRHLGLPVAGFYLAGCSSKKGVASASGEDMTDFLTDISPIDRSPKQFFSNTYSGDNPHEVHPVLWDKDGFITAKGGLPEPSKKAKVVIVGGGMSGLLMAYQLKDYSPIILEQAPRMGGNSKGESFEGLEYSIGAAYFTSPAKDSKADQLFKELGVYDIVQSKKEGDAVILKNKLLKHFWEGEADPKAKEQLKKVHDYLHQMGTNENGLTFPEVPTPLSLRDYVNSLDNQSLYEHIKALVGGTIHPHLKTLIEHYCWSSFAGSSKEISAASGLNFLAGEASEVCVAKGGNSGIAEKILFALGKYLPKENFKNKALVFDVNHKDQDVEVTYADEKGNLTMIKADYVVLCCPKFITAKILNNIEPDRLESIQKLTYRSYLVANVIINKKCPVPYYDLYLLGDGNTKLENVQKSSEKQKATDICVANFADPDDAKTVLTFYRGIPYNNFRATLIDDENLKMFREEFMVQAKTLLPVIGLDPKDIMDIRMTRWGHPLPLAEKGLIAKKIVDKIKKPFGERVYFCEQDNWMLPAIETCLSEALTVSEQMLAKLKV